jgi:hypothetical protein
MVPQKPPCRLNPDADRLPRLYQVECLVLGCLWGLSAILAEVLALFFSTHMLMELGPIVFIVPIAYGLLWCPIAIFTVAGNAWAIRTGLAVSYLGAISNVFLGQSCWGLGYFLEIAIAHHALYVLKHGGEVRAISE